MTIDSFNKASNVIGKPPTACRGRRRSPGAGGAPDPDPRRAAEHGEREERRALAALDPLFALRYSATHRNPYNVVYRLTPFEAYRQGLVKRIEVASVVTEDEHQPAIHPARRDQVEEEDSDAKLAVDKLMAKGAVKRGALSPCGLATRSKRRQADPSTPVTSSTKSTRARLRPLRERYRDRRRRVEGSGQGSHVHSADPIHDRGALCGSKLAYGSTASRCCPCSSSTGWTTTRREDGMIRRIFDRCVQRTKKAHGRLRVRGAGARARKRTSPRSGKRGARSEEIDTTGEARRTKQPTT